MRTYQRMRIAGGTYFFTVVTHERTPLFTDANAIECLARVVQAVRQRHPFEIIAEIVLPDHIHMIWTLPDHDSDYSNRWMLIKSGLSRQLARPGSEIISASRARRRERAIWQRRFWEHTVRDDVELGRCIDYIHWNAVKHGLVQRPSAWPSSSFHSHVREGRYPADWMPEAIPEFATPRAWD